MALLYKHFTALRTAFCALSLCFFTLAPMTAMAADAIFTVEGVAVDVTAEDAIKARNQAFSKAQSQAFQILSSRMRPGESASTPSSGEISMLIKDFEVTQEKLSNVRYIGTYTFRFNEDSVRNYFSGRGLQYTDVSSKPSLILPFHENDGRTDLWSPYNPWLAAWKRADVAHEGLVPIEVPIGDLQDVSDIEDHQAFSYRESRLRRMLRRYNAEEAVLAIARPDENLAFVENAGDNASGTLVVDLYRTDRAGPEPVQRLFVEARAGETLEDLYLRATRDVQSALQRNWKEQTMTQSAGYQPGHYLPVKVRYNSLKEWSSIRTALLNVRGVDDVAIKSMSAKEAHLHLVFQGEESRVKRSLSRAGFNLSALSVDPYAVDGSQSMYELRRN